MTPKNALPNAGTTTETKPRDETRTRRIPPYNVILLNDDHHSMEFVVEVLCKVLGCAVERAFQFMMEAHESGRAIIWTGTKEVAELKAEQIQTFPEIRASDGAPLGPLGCCIEPPGPDATTEAAGAKRIAFCFAPDLPERNPMSIEPLAIGVCSWSLQVKSVPELQALLQRLGIDVVQIACGDPHHAAWAEGDAMPAATRSAGFRMTGAMLGFPGEDYTTPQTIKRTGGFGNPATRTERLERFLWALERTRALGLNDLMLHAGFIPEPGDPDRRPFLDTLGKVSAFARAKDVTVAFETGQETADLLRLTLDELKCPNLKVNFDPANVLLYEMGDPLRAVEILGPDIRSVHVKDAILTKIPGTWGEEVPLGQGQVNIRAFLQTLKKVGYRGPLCIEREVGNQEDRMRDVLHGIGYLRECLAA